MILRPFKKIKEQEEIIKNLSEAIGHYKRLEENREKKEKEGLHECNSLCKGCKYLIKDGYYGYACKLDCKCEDRREHNESNS